MLGYRAESPGFRNIVKEFMAPVKPPDLWGKSGTEFVGLREYLALIKRRWWVVVVVLVASVAHSASKPPREYHSTAPDPASRGHGFFEHQALRQHGIYPNQKIRQLLKYPVGREGFKPEKLILAAFKQSKWSNLDQLPDVAVASEPVSQPRRERCQIQKEIDRKDRLAAGSQAVEHLSHRGAADGLVEMLHHADRKNPVE